MITNKHLRLRPSVSLVPIDQNKGRYDFFQTSTRRTIALQFGDQNLIRLIENLNGQRAVAEIANVLTDADPEQVNFLLDYMIEKCLVEDVELAEIVDRHKFRRVLHFIGDYVPYHKILETWENISSSWVIVIGLGAMGSWISTMLAQSGVKNFILIDPDRVTISNLNRSLYSNESIGKYKVDCIENTIRCINSDTHIIKITEYLDGNFNIDNVLRGIHTRNILLINCADFPNVDTTSKIIGKYCMENGIPHIIAGGYNLHLSLLGPTIIPHSTACYECMRLSLDEINSPELKGVTKLVRKDRNIGNLAPITGVSASFVVNEALRIVSNSSYLSPAMTNKRGEYNFLTNEINYTLLPKRSDCSWCGCD